MNKGVIVLGGHVQGYGIVKIFGKNHIPSVVIDSTNICIARHSKYCTKFIQTGYKNLTDTLTQLKNDNHYVDWLLIPTDDYYVRILSQNRGLLSNYFRITIDDWSIVEIFFNKCNTYPLVKELGIPIPQTYYPVSLDEVNTLSQMISFPCIIKPAIMLDFYKHFKKKVFVCSDIKELTENYQKSIDILKTEEIIVQEIIPGNSENQYSVGIFAIQGEIINSLVARRKRQHPIDFGNATTFSETVKVPELDLYASKIINAVRFSGICEIEFKYDERDKKYKFLEVNPRTWKWHSISEKAKIPFLLSMYKYIYENIPIKNNLPVEAGWRDLVTDLPIILKLLFHGMFIKSKMKNIEQAVFNFSDPKPFIYQIIYLPYLIIKR